MSMPRSLAGDRSSLSRGSVLTSRSDAISVGSAVTRHWVNSVSDIYGPDEIEELLEDLNRLEMASFDGVMIDYDGVRPTSSEMNIMQNEAVISGCITQGPPEEHDVEDFDIDGSQVLFFFKDFAMDFYGLLDFEHYRSRNIAEGSLTVAARERRAPLTLLLQPSKVPAEAPPLPSASILRPSISLPSNPTRPRRPVVA